jgi:hypothetical protein
MSPVEMGEGPSLTTSTLNSSPTLVGAARYCLICRTVLHYVYGSRTETGPGSEAE